MISGGTRLVLVAHGSRDVRAAQSTRGLARAVARRLAVHARVPASEQRRVPAPRGASRRVAVPPYSPVSAAFLDFATPRLPDVLASAAGRGESAAIVVPLLLTAAYHGRVDVPAEIERARAAGAPVDVGLATVLGPVDGPVLDRHVLDLMTSALIRRLDQTGALAGSDGILLAGAGSREDAALRTVDLVADALGTALRRPCRAGYASGGGLGVAEAMAALHADGARRIAVGSYFLAPGLLHDRVIAQARDAGALAVAGPLGAAPEIVRLVLARAEASRVSHPLAA
ncbi:sirohydrochlorin chelatase [Rugosimonospora africana]|uniref:Cobalamin biosynthesis protein n=1 Tax=Rugosimonospora africana TaxID=556532 RepID=A0A8J3QNS0_9ACTN|nr:CbiX/SirB N-terminal domain-containing protein [Rugosimonospora africana]GIH12773.1 cobalamin biosynthesis protein [Rugosimonospora africana]